MKPSLRRSLNSDAVACRPTSFTFQGSQPITLPEVLTPGIVFGALDQLQNRPKEKQEARLKQTASSMEP